ncbi:DUF2723 domain-containing protein [candidate division WOR-3 bacterium]|nr:DUF2723 domain-containing protein [candidate division WOR-3 bacterium]
MIAAFIWLILVKVIERIKKIETRREKYLLWFGATAGALISAFSYTCWWNSVESEGYGISASILILSLWLVLKWEENLKTGEHKKYLLLIAYLITLSSGIHLTPLLAAPGILLFMLLRNRQEIKDPIVLQFIVLVLPFFALCASVPLWGVGILGVFAIAFIWWHSRRTSRDIKFLALTALLLVLGFTTNAYLIIRARQDPRINEVAPTNIKKLWEGFTRKQYGPNKLGVIFERQTQTKENKYNFVQAVGYQVKFFADYLIWQWAPYPREERWEGRTLSRFAKFGSVAVNAIFVGLSLFGMLWHWKRERSTFYLLWITLFMASIALLFYINFKFSPSDPNLLHRPAEVRERHYFFGSAFSLFGLYAGFGIWGLLSILKRWWRFAAPVLGILAFVPVFGNFYSHANRRGHWVADDYGFNMLMSVDDRATLFTNGDNDTFPLWFAQEVKNTKSSVNVANLSLLNTDWHIKQLKKRGVPISFTDYEIENLIPWPIIKDGNFDRNKMLLIKDFAVRDILATNGGYKFKKKIFMPVKREALPKKYRSKFPDEMDIIPPSYYTRRIPRELWVRLPEEYFLPHQEFADLILKDYKPEKPVYFAVTVSEGNMEGFRPYVQMEGLAYRVVGSNETDFEDYTIVWVMGHKFDIEKSDSLLNSVYRYRAIFDPRVYKDKNTKRLLTNYAACYFAIGMAYRKEGEMHKAIESLEFGKLFRAEGAYPFNYQLASLYKVIGEHKKAEQNFRKFAEESNGSAGWYALGEYYREIGEIEKAEESFKHAIEGEDQSLGYAGLIKIYYTKNDTVNLNKMLEVCVKNPAITGKMLSIFRAEHQDTLAALLLKTWLSYHPQDTIAQSLFNGLQ